MAYEVTLSEDERVEIQASVGFVLKDFEQQLVRAGERNEYAQAAWLMGQIGVQKSILEKLRGL
jgi:hypothetical protein